MGAAMAVETLEKAQAADGGSYGPPCMQLFLRGCGLCDYRIFSKTPPSPLNLKRGSTSPPAPSPQERSPTGKPAVLYSQTSSRPKGLLVEFNAIELRLFDATELRVFMRRGRG